MKTLIRIVAKDLSLEIKPKVTVVAQFLEKHGEHPVKCAHSRIVVSRLFIYSFYFEYHHHLLSQPAEDCASTWEMCPDEFRSSAAVLM